jgi:hypothetical protein
VREGARQPFREPPDLVRERRTGTAIVDHFAGGNVEVVDVADLFTEPSGGIRAIAPDGRFAFYDKDHLSDRGTAMVHARLDAAIRRALAQR